MHAPAWLVRWLAAAAALARAFAGLLERASGGGAAPEATMQALAARFPGAPNHWLQVIAERAPHLAEAPPSEPAPPRGPPPPPLRPMAAAQRSWPSRLWSGDEPAASDLARHAVPHKPPTRERRAAALFPSFSRRRRPASVVAEPRRRAPGWTAAFEPVAPHHPAAPTPASDPSPAATRRKTLTLVGAETPRARTAGDWNGPSREADERAGPVFTPPPGRPQTPRWPFLDPADEHAQPPRGWSDDPAQAIRPQTQTTNAPRTPARPSPVFTAGRGRATSAPAFAPPPRRRRTDKPDLPPTNAWPALPPGAAPEIEDADDAPPRLRDLAFEQERGLWSG